MPSFQARLFVSLLSVLFPILLPGSISPVGAFASTATNGCGGIWHVVPIPSPGPVYNDLWGLVGISHTDVWGVGASVINQTFYYPLNSGVTEHWNGKRWSVIPSPQPGDYNNYLEGVAALSASDIWAVGAHQNQGGGYEKPLKTFIEHWDGTRWSLIPSPNTNGFYNSLEGVAALTPDNVWAVGSYGDLQGYSKTMIEQWDGTRWRIIASPNVGTYDNNLGAITALAANDIWAAGNSSNGKGGARTLIEHWDGTQWSVVPSPSVGTFDNVLWSLAGVASNDVWVVGDYFYQNTVNTLAEHWDGTQWSVVNVPNPIGGDNDLHGVAAVTSNDVWAVGGSALGPIIIHWNGHQWKTIASPGQSSWFLNRVVALNAHNLWAVGSTTTQMLAMHYC